VIRAVLDANVVASGVLGFDRAASSPGAVLRAWYRRDFELIIADALIAEIERTPTAPYFASRVDPQVARLTMASLRDDATRTALTASVTGAASHPEDDVVLDAAVSAAAAFLVTGDKQLQRLGAFQGGQSGKLSRSP